MGATNSCDDESKMRVSTNGKHLYLTEDSILHLLKLYHLDVNENFKDVLLASLYAQVDFLKNELKEMNLLIRRSTISKSKIPYKIKMKLVIQIVCRMTQKVNPVYLWIMTVQLTWMHIL